MHYRETDFGFEWGAANIRRVYSNNKKGWIIMDVITPKEHLQIYVTKTGKTRVFNKHGKEMGVSNAT